MLKEYRKHVAEHAAEGVVPKPLNAAQTASLCELIKNTPAGEEAFHLDLLVNKIKQSIDLLQKIAVEANTKNLLLSPFVQLSLYFKSLIKSIPKIFPEVFAIELKYLNSGIPLALLNPEKNLRVIKFKRRGSHTFGNHNLSIV